MAKSSPITYSLSIPKHPSEILSFTKMALAHILEHRELDVPEQQRIKLILIELVTNTIKHASGADSEIKLMIDHLTLTIHKMEKGVQIEFMSSGQQIPFEEIDKTIRIAFSEENKHHIKTLGKYKFKFLNPLHEGLNIEDIPEHFGFYIITLAADSFIYQYHPEINENQYIIKINIPGK